MRGAPLVVIAVAACFPAADIEIPVPPDAKTWFVGVRGRSTLYAGTTTLALSLDGEDTILLAPSPHSLDALGLTPGDVRTIRSEDRSLGCEDRTRAIPSVGALVRAAASGAGWVPLEEDPSTFLNAWLEPLPIARCSCVARTEDEQRTPIACLDDCPAVEIIPPEAPDLPEMPRFEWASPECDVEQLRVPGGCLPLGAPCAGPWPVTSDPSPAHVEPGAQNGNGSEASPFGTIAEALLSPASTILLARGSHAVGEVLLANGEITLIGCGPDTRITAPGEITIASGDLHLESASIEAELVHVVGPAILRAEGVDVRGGVAVTLGSLRLERVRITTPNAGLLSLTSSITLAGVEITGAVVGVFAYSSTVTGGQVTLDRPVNGIAISGSRFVVSRVVILDPRDNGVIVSRGLATLEDVAVIRPRVAGIIVQTATTAGRAELIATRVYVEDPRNLGVLVGGAGIGNIETAVLTDVTIRAADGYRAISYEGGEGLSLLGCAITGGFEGGFIRIAGNDAGSSPGVLSDVTVTGTCGSSAIDVEAAQTSLTRIDITATAGNGLRLNTPLFGTEVFDLSVSRATTSALIEIATGLDQRDQIFVTLDRAHLAPDAEGGKGILFRQEVNVKMSNVDIDSPRGIGGRPTDGIIYQVDGNFLASLLELDHVRVRGSDTGINLFGVAPEVTKLSLSKAEISGCRVGAVIDPCFVRVLAGPDITYQNNGVSIDIE